MERAKGLLRRIQALVVELFRYHVFCHLHSRDHRRHCNTIELTMRRACGEEAKQKVAPRTF
jgi:hypothetical protein